MERPTKLGSGAKGLVLLLVVFVVAYPFMAVLATSLSSQREIVANGGLVLWPEDPTLDAYRLILSGGQVTNALGNSVLIALLGTAASLAATVSMAYALSRKGLTGGRSILLIALFTMLFSPGIIPNFLLVTQLGLFNTFLALVLPTLISAFNLVVLRSFFMNLPTELIDSARIDGAGEVRILFQIVLPLSKAVLAVISLFYAVTYWNAFFNVMLYIEDTEKWTLPMILRQYVLQGQSLANSDAIAASGAVPPPAQAVQMAVLVVAMVPILLVYPFLQRYFTKGVLTGAIKGLVHADPEGVPS